jgi:hypothetical protein
MWRREGIVEPFGVGGAEREFQSPSLRWKLEGFTLLRLFDVVTSILA